MTLPFGPGLKKGPASAQGSASFGFRSPGPQNDFLLQATQIMRFILEGMDRDEVARKMGASRSQLDSWCARTKATKNLPAGLLGLFTQATGRVELLNAQAEQAGLVCGDPQALRVGSLICQLVRELAPIWREAA